MEILVLVIVECVLLKGLVNEESKNFINHHTKDLKIVDICCNVSS